MLVSRVKALCRLYGSCQNQCKVLCSAIQHCHSTSLVPNRAHRYFTSAADNKQPPKLWTVLEPDLEEVLVPRKLSVSPLESWLSLRYSLPAHLKAPAPLQEGELTELVLPPSVVPSLEDGESSRAPLSCRNVLKIRRRKMNKHKYKKLMKRTKFLRRRVKLGRMKRKQARFERDLTRIWRQAGLKKPPEGWTAPKIYIKHQETKRH
ncbi:aurora kinase A-interacting protein [Electrophorus electricus]|uniref:Small ribosomal subunit protein mS38 n=1 Tax=Electrophorus electricus TaxID=8005 RepID=A0A4W4HAL7_ELEEL|nr:aurora kinase A-interacting protein [Electrophorus electricus]